MSDEVTPRTTEYDRLTIKGAEVGLSADWIYRCRDLGSGLFAFDEEETGTVSLLRRGVDPDGIETLLDSVTAEELQREVENARRRRSNATTQLLSGRGWSLACTDHWHFFKLTHHLELREVDDGWLLTVSDEVDGMELAEIDVDDLPATLAHVDLLRTAPDSALIEALRWAGHDFFDASRETLEAAYLLTVM